jgi:hypothetical protein
MYTMKKELKEALDEDGEGTSETLSEAMGYPVQAHHLISCSVMDKFEKGKLRDLAKASGYDINSGNNGIALPAYFGHQRKDNKVRHRGGHWEDYYEKVRKELAKVYTDYEGTNPCDLEEEDRENIRGALQARENFIRRSLNAKNSWWLYPWSEELWTKDYRDEGPATMNSSRKREGSYSAGEEWATKYTGRQIKRRHRIVRDKPVVRSEWYDKYDYPAPKTPTS